jgi:methyl-accepting chemotaxis protein
MLLIAGLWSIYELNFIGSSVQDILDDNYQSIHAAKVMNEALERQDSAMLLLLLGERKEGRTIMISADSLFQAKFKFASNNITIPGEQRCLESIDSTYKIYQNLWERPIVDSDKESNLDWYFREVHQTFLAVKSSINELLNLNDQIMYKTASELKNRSRRAIMPGIVAIISALVFTFLFSYLINYYFVSPIITITARVRRFIEKRTPFDAAIETRDEIYKLAEAVEQLCVSVSDRE